MFVECGALLIRAEPCIEARREDDTRFILESCEDKEGSRQWRKDKERHVRAVSVCVSVCIYEDCYECVPHACMQEYKYVILN